MTTSGEPQELWQGRALLQAFGHEDDVVAVGGVPPEPDVIGVDPSGAPVIGVEVTEIHPGGRDRRQIEGAVATVLRGVEEAHDAAGLPPVLVSVIFTPDFHPTKAERRSVVKQLSATIAANMPKAKGIRVSLDSLADNGPPVPNCVDVMNIQLIDAGE